MTKLLSREEVRQMLRMSKPLMARMIREGVIPQPIRFGALQRWRPETIEEFLEQQEKAAQLVA